MSEYDQVCSEGEPTSILLDSLDLFQEIITSEWFSKEPVILLLNKKDLFDKNSTRLLCGITFLSLNEIQKARLMNLS
jgi:hypothetical protein